MSTVTAAILFASLHVLRKRTGGVTGKIAFWVFAVVTLVIPVVTIGIFEGGYNHALKDALYFTGASRGLMQQLFPPPTYEMPNDAFFEITGVLQLVPARRKAERAGVSIQFDQGYSLFCQADCAS